LWVVGLIHHFTQDVPEVIGGVALYTSDVIIIVRH